MGFQARFWIFKVCIVRFEGRLRLRKSFRGSNSTDRRVLDLKSKGFRSYRFDFASIDLGFKSSNRAEWTANSLKPIRNG